MVVDTVVKNCKIVSPGAMVSAGIAIDNGKIIAIGKDAHLPDSRRTIDAKGNYVLPGIVDPHVHIGLFHSFQEEIYETAAAAYGGITTVGNYVGQVASLQMGSYEGSFEKWKDIWERGSLVDAFFHGSALSGVNIDEILINAKRYGITSYKFMMHRKGPDAEKLGSEQQDDWFLWTGFAKLGSLGYPVRAMVHAENIDIIYRVSAVAKATGRNDLVAWDEARPGFCEVLDIERAISIARVTGAPLYVVHVSYGDSVGVISKAKADGVDVVAETCPHYLVLTKYHEFGPLGKVQPPLRDEQSAERLWQGIREGIIECIGSDHCSTTRATKQSLWEATPGMPGLETFLPIMLSEGVNKGKITLEKLVEICCYNNARVFGLYPMKGTISIGSDADIVIVDLDKKVKLNEQTSHYCIADYCPYEGWEIKGWPILTMLRGKILVEDGEIVAQPGVGRYIPIKSGK
jgi:dihydroorotase (multifunctional complex type)